MNLDTEFILTRLGIPYEQKGNGQLLARCPFHDDHHYSLSIKKDPLLYNCFACGAKGNWFSLIKDLTGENPYKFLGLSKEEKSDITFLSSLRNYYNNQQLKKNKIESEFKEFKVVAKIFNPFEKEESYDYCKKRNISLKDIKDYEIFYIEKGYIGITDFRNRLVIPIRNKNGNIIAYEGRDITGIANKKCIYPYESKVGLTIFQNKFLDYSKPTLIVEGILDVISASKALPNVQITTYFGIQLSNFQKEEINKFKNVILMLDSDDGGTRGIDNFISIYPNNFKIAKLKEGKDPNSATAEEIQEAYSNVIERTEYLLQKNNLLQKNLIKW